MKAAAKRAPALEVTYTLECEQEDIAPEDQFTDPADVQWVRDQLHAGNDWAWFSAKVTATVEVDGESFTGADYLGGCSYHSEQDFRAGDYYADMCTEALADLVRNLRAASNRGGAAVVALSRLRGAL